MHAATERDDMPIPDEPGSTAAEEPMVPNLRAQRLDEAVVMADSALDDVAPGGLNPAAAISRILSTAWISALTADEFLMRGSDGRESTTSRIDVAGAAAAYRSRLTLRDRVLLTERAYRMDGSRVLAVGTRTAGETPLVSIPRLLDAARSALPTR